MLPGVRHDEQEQAGEGYTELAHFTSPARIFNLDEPRVIDTLCEINFGRTDPARGPPAGDDGSSSDGGHLCNSQEIRLHAGVDGWAVANQRSSSVSVLCSRACSSARSTVANSSSIKF